MSAVGWHGWQQSILQPIIQSKKLQKFDQQYSKDSINQIPILIQYIICIYYMVQYQFTKSVRYKISNIMKNKISFTSVLKSKTQNLNSMPKVPLAQQFNQPLQSAFSYKNSSSLADIMNQFQQYPDQEYVLNFDAANTNMSSNHYTSQSDNSSVFDSKGSKGQAYVNFDDWIASQARQQNKENITDVQPRLRKTNKAMLNFFASKESHHTSKEHPKQPKRVISSKNKIGLGKLCSMFDQNQIEDQEPVWKCQPNQSSQSLSSINQYSKASQSRESFADPVENFQSGSSNMDMKDFLKPKTKGLISSKGKPKQSTHRFTGEEEKDLKIKFAKIRSDEQSKIAKVQQTHLCSMKEPPRQSNSNVPIKIKPQKLVDFQTEKKKDSQYSESEEDYRVEQEQKQIIRQNTIRSIQQMAQEIVNRKSHKSNEEDQQMLLTQKSKSNSNKSSERNTPRISTLRSNGSIKAIEQMNQCLNTQERIKAVQNQLSEIIKLKKSENKKGNSEKVTFENLKQNRGSFAHQNRRNDYIQNDETHVPHFPSPKYGENAVLAENYYDRRQSQSQSQYQKPAQQKCQVGYSFAHQFNPLLSNGVKISEYYKPNYQQKVQDSIKQSINNSKVIEEKKNEYSIESSVDMNSRNFRKLNQVSNSKIPRIQSIDFSNYQAQHLFHRRSQQIGQNQQQNNLNKEVQEQIRVKNVKRTQDISDQELHSQKMLGSKEKFILENSIPDQIKVSRNIDDDTVVQDEQSQGFAQRQHEYYETNHQKLKLEDLQVQQKPYLKQIQHETLKQSLKQTCIEQKPLIQKFQPPFIHQNTAQSVEHVHSQTKRQKNLQIENIIIQSTKKNKKKLDEFIQKTVQSDCKPCSDYIQGQQSEVVTGAIRIPIQNTISLVKNPSTKISIEFIDSDKKPNIQTLIKQQKKQQNFEKIVSGKKQDSKDFELQLSLNLAESFANCKPIAKNIVPTRQITIQKPTQQARKEQPKVQIKKQQTISSNTFKNSIKNQSLLRNSLLKKSGRFSNGDSDFQLQLQMDFDL